MSDGFVERVTGRLTKFVMFVVFAIVAIFIFGFVVMLLWNWLMPLLFGLRTITFWQALGLVVLSKIFFGGFHVRPGRERWRRRMWERWEKMTPEEREKFRECMGGGFRGPAPSEPKA